MSVLYIDPGTSHVGVAVFHNSTLQSAGLLRAPKGAHTTPQRATLLGRIIHDRIAADGTIERAVIEVPRVYPHGRKGGTKNPESILMLTLVCGSTMLACEMAGAPALMVRPSEWKGTVPKRIHQNRILAALTDEEKNRIDPTIPGSLLHNTIDAIGIGLWDHKNKRNLR